MSSRGHRIDRGLEVGSDIVAASKQKTRAGLVHLGTKVATQFGLRDEDGNVEKQEPVRSELPILTAAAWEDHRQMAITARKEFVGVDPKRTVVHLVTMAEIVFGQEDDEGNVIRQIPQSVNFTKFSVNVFSECWDKIVEQRQRLRSQMLSVGE